MPDQESYQLLGELFRSGPTDELRRALKVFPELESAAREVTEGSDRGDAEDEIAAAHHSMFGFNVFPHASVFLEEDGFLGKDVTESARAFYERSGLYAGDEREAADHITTELLFCSRLADDAPAMAEFFDTHLFAWLPSFVFAIERRKELFYSQLGRVTLDLVIKHRKKLFYQKIPADLFEDSEEPEQPVGSTSDGGRSRSGDRSRGDSMSSGELVERFSGARKCGLFLSRGDIIDLARSLKLPTGFGGRMQMLRTMFDSSQTYEREEELCAGLLNVCDQEIGRWQAIVADGAPEALVSWSEYWTGKLRASQGLLMKK